VVLPPEYAEWSELGDPSPSTMVARTVSSPGVAGTGKEGEGFRIVSPLDGDLYRVPPGADPRYSSVALRAIGGGVRWFVDGRPHAPGRWVLRAGTHRFRAVSAQGQTAEATIRVE
jgi:hypothetical protein